MTKIRSLRGVVQRYAWGLPGAQARVARLAGLAGETGPCAELWFGTHPSGPATLDDGTPLAQELDARGLSFLLKVLSIGQPLSIQAHPDKARAEKLHARDPEHYPDANHKPEVVVALSPMEILYGFRPCADIVATLGQVGSLKPFLPATKLSEEKFLATLFWRLMQLAGEPLKQSCRELAAIIPWVARLADSYPEGDPGLLAFGMMQHVTLSPGQALFVGANVPHAYLCGEAVECMACSDNVVRAGLTPKFRDLPTLLSMVRYDTAPASVISAQTDIVAQCGDFALERRGSGGVFQRKAPAGSEILLVVEGHATAPGFSDLNLPAGTALFVPATCSAYEFTCQEGLVVRASQGAP